MSDFERGKEFGEQIKSMRKAGINYDPRWEIVDEAKSNRLGFDEFMKGLNAAFQEAQ